MIVGYRKNRTHAGSSLQSGSSCGLFLRSFSNGERDGISEDNVVLRVLYFRNFIETFRKSLMQSQHLRRMRHVEGKVGDRPVQVPRLTACCMQHRFCSSASAQILLSLKISFLDYVCRSLLHTTAFCIDENLDRLFLWNSSWKAFVNRYDVV